MSNYSIEKKQSAKGWYFEFVQGKQRKEITTPFGNDPLIIEEEKKADDLKKSMELHTIFFDDEGNMMIPSPLYFLAATKQSGVDDILAEVDDWEIFWSQQPCFHFDADPKYAAIQRSVSGPVELYLKDLQLKPVQLKLVDYSCDHLIKPEHLLDSSYVESLSQELFELTDKEKQVVTYLGLEFPHTLASLAWISGKFGSDDEFVRYMLALEGCFVPGMISPKEYDQELYARLSILTELKEYLKNW